MNFTLGGLYVLTDPELMPAAKLVHKVEQAIMGGARLVQYRDKSHTVQRRQEQVRNLLELCKRHDVPLIVNDDVELAASSGAHGVHLGKDDASAVHARCRLGDNALIGVSCYNDINRAIQAQADGADYVAFGSFFPSRTKPTTVSADTVILKQAKAVLTVPICAIGGITTENASALIEAGADMLAVISDVFAHPRPFEIAQKFTCLFV